MAKKNEFDLLDNLMNVDFDKIDHEREDRKPSQFGSRMKESNTKELHDLFLIGLDELVPYQSKGDRDFSPWPEEEIAELVNTMDEEDGVYEPILVRQLENNKFEILSGEHRVEACKRKGLKSIKALVYRGCSDTKAMDIFLLTNLQRRKTKISDQIYGWSKFAENHPSMKSGSKEVLYKITGMFGGEISLNSTQYYRFVRMASLLSEWIQALDDQKLSVRAGYELSGFSKEDQRLFLPYLNTKKITEIALQTIKERVNSGESLSKPLIDSVLNPKKEQRNYDGELRSGMKQIKVNIKKRINPEFYRQIDTIIASALDMYLSAYPQYQAEEI